MARHERRCAISAVCAVRGTLVAYRAYGAPVKKVKTMPTYVEIARNVMTARTVQGAAAGSERRPETEPEALEYVLRGRAIELWSDRAGRLFLVADDADAGRMRERSGARRGEIYTAAEVRRIVVVGDPVVVAEIHDWKRRFDGTVREFRPGGRPK